MKHAYTTELRIALEAAKKAGDIQLRSRNKIARIEYKPDNSPVTAIDKTCEGVIRDMLLAAFPGDGILGEETGDMPGTSGRKWIVDPLDGTRPYLRGIPTFSTIIGLEHDGDYVVGVTHFAALNETCWASKGGGAFCNRRRLHVSKTKKTSSAMGSSLGYIEKSRSKQGKKLLSLMKRWDYVYGFMDAYSYMSVAAGKLDVCISLIDKPWDKVSAACIVSEAGGRFSDIHGKKTIYSDTLILSNGLLHEKIVHHFQ